MGQTELQQSGSIGSQPVGFCFPLLSRRAEPLSPTPHGWLSTASCGHMQSRPLPTSACRTINQRPSCPNLPGKSALLPLQQACGTGCVCVISVALMSVGGGSGRLGLTSLTASPAPSSCPCILREHHRLNVQHLETLFLENRWPAAKRSDSFVSSS